MERMWPAMLGAQSSLLPFPPQGGLGRGKAGMGGPAGTDIRSPLRWHNPWGLVKQIPGALGLASRSPAPPGPAGGSYAEEDPRLAQGPASLGKQHHIST